MKAMILAAGVGSRLRPMKEALPKALVVVEGKPMLELVIRRLMDAGVDQIIINVFHLADRIVDFVNSKKSFGIPIEFSRETELLDTGGGLKKASYFFDDGRPFFLHNVDVFSDIDLKMMYDFHVQFRALATLAAESDRKSGRYLLFDEKLRLCGWESVSEKRQKWAGQPRPKAERLAFCGIHVISPEIFPKMSETGIFSINKTYLRLAGQGEHIQPFLCDGYYWRDIGAAGKLEEVRGSRPQAQ